AMMFWGQRPKVNIWSTDDWSDPPELQLRRTEFRRNTATIFGGGLAFSGPVEGDAVLFQANVSGGPGGAIADWRVGVLPEPYDGVFGTLVAATQPAEPDSIALARPILVDNVASNRGAALAASSAAVAIGNGLIARNRLSAGSGGAVSGAKVTLVNTTIADNQAGGLGVTAGGPERLGHSALLGHTRFNRLGPGAVSDAGGNLPVPADECSGGRR